MTEDRFIGRTDWRERIIRYAPLILWVAVIFVASSTTGSMTSTSRFIRPFLIWLFPSTPEDIIAIYHGYIRKSAHFFEYAVLAFWASRAFWDSTRESLKRNWHFAAFLFVFLTASLDELNQSFNTSRTGTFNDVLLDCAGGITMIGILLLVRGLSSRRVGSPLPE
ncbi:MAG: VanZ family protein [Acidobacteria bacterium]|nr:VanZ family protein [Acidobacteriota bacterium]MBK8148281.1 VanZ family protein [Acidobacteriota bacterium]MBK8813437.1 VanZ family protein [Acidobacteriota bacterium]